MRRFFLAVVLLSVLVRPSLTLSQEVPAPADAAPEVQHSTGDEPLRVFEPSDRMSPNTAATFVACVVFGTVAIVIVMFLLVAYFHEPSYTSKPYKPTEVVRAEGFVPKPREREHRQERFNLDDD